MQKELNKKMHEHTIKRISQESNRGEDKSNDLLERASAFTRDILESIQALAGTTACKGVQIARLRQWAKDNGCWIEDPSTLGIYVDRGSENEVYMSTTDLKIYKLNDFRYSDDNLQPFFERISAHNCYFKDCAYTLIGFSVNQSGKVCAVLTQQVITNARMATPKEIASELERLGFHAEDNNEYFTNNTHDIFDAVPNNVLVDDTGHIYFIDTIIFKSEDNGISTYRKYSPNSHTNKKNE